jgi:N-acetylmuramoyl-L-alanine amidase
MRRSLPLIPLVAVAALPVAADKLTAAGAAAAPRPPIVQSRIPFPEKRKRETRRYTQRHYGISTDRLSKPRVIVQHYTGSDSYHSAFETFARDVPDVELHELPGLCAHFVIDANGVIHQLVSLRLICRHTVGLNWTAIGIEHVGRSDGQVMSNRRQLRSSLRLTRWLQATYGIATRNVIGHRESLQSPYHRERVARLRRQTHGDFAHRTMKRYRRMLARAAAAAVPNRRVDLGRSVQGRRISALAVGDPGAKRKVLVFGCIHGDERAGIRVVRRLARSAAPPGVQLWLVESLNPDGAAANRRQNARGVDLNRNFPRRWHPIGRRWDQQYSGPRPVSEPETRIARRLILRLRPRITIWFHQPLALVDRSGGDPRVQRRFSRLSGLPLRQIGPYPGTATRWQNHAIAATTAFVVELPGGRPSARQTKRWSTAVSVSAQAH